MGFLSPAIPSTGFNPHHQPSNPVQKMCIAQAISVCACAGKCACGHGQGCIHAIGMGFVFVHVHVYLVIGPMTLQLTCI